jgi:hypothetical protein
MLFFRRYSLMCDLSFSLGPGMVMITFGAGMIECAGKRDREGRAARWLIKEGYVVGTYIGEMWLCQESDKGMIHSATFKDRP